MENKNYIQEWNTLFIQHRAYLVSFAFRMTGSLSEAEDIVQDTFIECAHVNPAEIKNHKSWLTKVCSNKGIDHLRSAYKRRETYPGTWLPDAIPETFQLWTSLKSPESPEKTVLNTESLTTSFLLLIEKLTPEERAIYLLSEVFEYSFKDIAEFLDKSEAACRKTAQRAREAVLSGHRKFHSSVVPEKMIASFFELVKQGDTEALSAMLADDSEFWADGGGKASASKVVINEKAKIARFFSGIKQSFSGSGARFEFLQVNSRPGLVLSTQTPEGWKLETIFSFEFDGDKIVRIYAQRNPDKLQASFNWPVK